MRVIIPGEDINIYVASEGKKKHPEAPPGFVDTNTYVKRLDPRTGEEEVVRILDERGKIIWKKGDEGVAGGAPTKHDWDALWPKYLDMTGKGMLAIDIARELGIPYKTLTSKIRRERVKNERAQKPVEIDPGDGCTSGLNVSPYPLNEVEGKREYHVFKPEPVTNPELLQEAILTRASIRVDKVLKDPVALALMKELLAQEVV